VHNKEETMFSKGNCGRRESEKNELGNATNKNKETKKKETLISIISKDTTN
jgi:hypothetical protein